MKSSIVVAGALAIALDCVWAQSANAQEVWSGYSLTFTKADSADPNLPSNQDRITPTTWITRAGTSQAGGFYNIQQESFFSRSFSPVNTEWAYDLGVTNAGLTISAANHANLTFGPWHSNFSRATSTVGAPGVLHLIAEDIYIDILVTSWSDGRTGSGGFSYMRGEPPIVYDGKVFMGNSSFPMAGVKVEALSNGQPVGGGTVMTDSAGGYILNVLPGFYQIRASVTYEEPATGDCVTVTNYPDHDPMYLGALGGLPVSSEPVPSIEFPWPVMLQSGLFGSTSAWTAFRDYFERDPALDASKKSKRHAGYMCFPMPNAFEDPLFGYSRFGQSTKEHTDNAILLSEWYKGFVEPVLDTWVDVVNQPEFQVNMVGHSMGGLITRAHKVSPRVPSVNRIVSLDGVHGGTRWPIPFAGLRENALNGLSLFGVVVIPGWNESYSDIGNDSKWLLFSADDDLLVSPNQSARGVGRVVEFSLSSPWNLFPSVVSIPWVNGEVVNVEYEDHFSIRSAKFILEDCADFFGKGTAPDERPSFSKVASHSSINLGTALISLSAPAGGADFDVVTLDSNGIVAGQILVQGAGNYNLSSSGVTLALEDLESVQIGSDAYLETFKLTLPPVGPITVTLNAGASGGASAELALQFDNGNILTVLGSPIGQAAGGAIQLTASILDPLGGTVVPNKRVSVVRSRPSQAWVDVQLPDQTTQLVRLNDDGLSGDGARGDGVFGGLFTDTLIEGRYSAIAHAIVVSGAETLQRSQEFSFFVQPSGASFSGMTNVETPDANSNGKFDSLVIEQDIAFLKNGSYRLVADLMDSMGGQIASVSSNFDNNNGATNYTSQLVIQGADIVRNGVDGPWLLTRIVLYDVGAGSLPVAYGADTMTQPYSIGAFEAPASPTISWLIPSSGDYQGGDVVSLRGTGLSDTTGVLIGGQAASFAIAGDDILQVTIPSSLLGRGKNLSFFGEFKQYVNVDVITPWGGVSAANAYVYEW